MIKEIIDRIITIFCFGVYFMLFCLFIYAGIDTLGNFGWITFTQ
jgi:hypothetical protein